MQLLTAHMQHLRFDWAAINTTMVLATLVACTLPMMVQLRRLRRQATRDLQRIFEQLDLMRLDAQEQLAQGTMRAGAPIPQQSPGRVLEIHGTAAASTGAEARVLVALKQARARQAMNS
jgi:hypothetical protein